MKCNLGVQLKANPYCKSEVDYTLTKTYFVAQIQNAISQYPIRPLPTCEYFY